jgi:hypothetical protein
LKTAVLYDKIFGLFLLGGIPRRQAQSSFKSTQNMPDCRLQALPPHSYINGGLPRPAGANFPRVTLLLGGGRRKSNAGFKANMLNFKYIGNINVKI